MVSVSEIHWRPTVAEIDLNAIRHNIEEMRRFLRKETAIMAVVKADAYGHGILPVSHAALAAGAKWLGVAIAEEALFLRERGICAPILVMGFSSPAAAEALVAGDISATVFSPDCLYALNAAGEKRGKRARAHLKLDTGMHRIGVKEMAELDSLLEVWRNCPHVEMEGVFSHFAAADEEDLRYSEEQLARFREMLGRVEYAGFHPLRHIANTAGGIALPEARFDMVRLGIGLYGYPPSETIGRQAGFRPVMSVKSALIRVFDIKAGEAVGYGCAFVAPRDMGVGIIPIGYGDGYRRGFSPGGQVLLKGRKLPLIGRICMDQCAVDVSAAPQAAVGDIVTLMGREGTERISAEDWARWVDSISYEMILGVSDRVPRVYLGGGI